LSHPFIIFVQLFFTRSIDPATGKAEAHELELGRLCAKFEKFENRRRWSDSPATNAEADLV